MAKLSMNPDWSTGYDIGYRDALDEAIRVVSECFTPVRVSNYEEDIPYNVALLKVQLKLEDLKKTKEQE